MYLLVGELAADEIPVAVSCRVLGLACQPTTGGSTPHSLTGSWPRPDWPTPSSMPTVTTPSSGTSSWPAKSDRLITGCRIGWCGGSAGTTVGGPGSANPRCGAKGPRFMPRRSMTGCVGTSPPKAGSFSVPCGTPGHDGSCDGQSTPVPQQRW